ncbi:ABC transporter permease [Egicoccus sp. AB-alg6-2]|uniref:ABC transporter permease n=1 Tax=Egicoccus sp. AB-alg6-2 TaxID=3242692 RepID=UPI00359E2F99
MNRNVHAVRVGARRGWHEFLLSLKSPQDQGFYLVMALGILTFLWFNRDNELEGTGLFLPTYAMPSILGGLIAFSMVIGPAYALAMEREDGTLLRATAVPRGLVGYVTGQIVLHSASLVPTFLAILVPGFLLFDDLMHRGAAGWFTVTWVIVLGLLATLPLGVIIGSLVPGVQKVGTWGILPVLVLVAISGIFFPVQALWGWVRTIAHVFPIYWLGLGMRSAFLPDGALVMEAGASWRSWQTVAVLSAWAVAGSVVAPKVLRRMAQRQSGSAVAAAREQAGQWVR